jgi:hypothetical protein
MLDGKSSRRAIADVGSLRGFAGRAEDRRT